MSQCLPRCIEENQQTQGPGHLRELQLKLQDGCGVSSILGFLQIKLIRFYIKVWHVKYMKITRVSILFVLLMKQMIRSSMSWKLLVNITMCQYQAIYTALFRMLSPSQLMLSNCYKFLYPASRQLTNPHDFPGHRHLLQSLNETSQSNETHHPHHSEHTYSTCLCGCLLFSHSVHAADSDMEMSWNIIKRRQTNIVQRRPHHVLGNFSEIEDLATTQACITWNLRVPRLLGKYPGLPAARKALKPATNSVIREAHSDPTWMRCSGQTARWMSDLRKWHIHHGNWKFIKKSFLKMLEPAILEYVHPYQDMLE